MADDKNTWIWIIGGLAVAAAVYFFFIKPASGKLASDFIGPQRDQNIKNLGAGLSSGKINQDDLAKHYLGLYGRPGYYY